MRCSNLSFLSREAFGCSASPCRHSQRRLCAIPNSGCRFREHRWATTMSYIELSGLVLGTGLAAAVICALLHRIVHRDTFRRYHEVGYAVFLQLGVIFAVLLAFIFDNVWSNYNVASQAIDSECGSLHGIAILGDRLPSPARGAILNDLHAYLTTVIDREWADMQRRKESQAADAKFQSLWQTVETVNTDPADNQIRGQMLSLLAAAHQSRETRL